MLRKFQVEFDFTKPILAKRYCQNELLKFVNKVRDSLRYLDHLVLRADSGRRLSHVLLHRSIVQRLVHGVRHLLCGVLHDIQLVAVRGLL